MKKGFTLAEVLITLAVIGVVAALTIPVLVQKYQKKQLYSQFMKTYNTISTALDNAIAEYGEPSDWNWAKWEYNYETGEDELVSEGDNPVEAYILSQLKYVKKCDTAKDCFADDYTSLSGSSGGGGYYSSYGDYGYNVTDMVFYYTEEYGSAGAVILADGSALTIGGDRDFMAIAFDTNGKKGPNVLGRDLFMMFYNPADERYNEPGGLELIEYEENENCDKNSNDDENGLGCASRLLQEGAMNY